MNKLILCSFLVAACWMYLASAQHGYKGGYFQYVNVPAHKQYEFGYKRGNPHHNTARFEQAKGHRFRTRAVWKDAKGGYGEHYWEYNHGPKGKGKHSSSSSSGGLSSHGLKHSAPHHGHHGYGKELPVGAPVAP